MIAGLLRLADAARHRARLRKWSHDQAMGRRGEDMAHRFLERRGMTVVARNYRPPSGHGEIDLVAWEGDTLVFVEVKSRQGGEFGPPERNVDSMKRRALRNAARDFARRADVPPERMRADLVTVVFTTPPAIEHWQDAFRLDRTV